MLRFRIFYAPMALVGLGFMLALVGTAGAVPRRSPSRPSHAVRHLGCRHRSGVLHVRNRSFKCAASTRRSLRHHSATSDSKSRGPASGTGAAATQGAASGQSLTGAPVADAPGAGAAGPAPSPTGSEEVTAPSPSGSEEVPAPSPSSPEEVPAGPASGGPASGFFAPSSVWNAPLAENEPLDPTSASLVAELQSMVNTEVSGKWGPWISTTGYSTPIYTVPASQPPVYVSEDNVNPSATLQSAFSAVPLPSNAQPSSGNDAELTVWQPSTDRLWEFWGMSHQSDGWHEHWGGAMEHVSSSPGYFSPSSWHGAQYNWGATATSLPLVGGLITLQDLQRGEINHALAVAL